jgi:deoxyadenosine/deoxycytidine kinase
MTRIISIEGNIGSGKSTLIRNLKNFVTDNPLYENVKFIQEPVDEWNLIKDENGTSIIVNFYSNQKEYAFSFQIMAYITRLRKLINNIELYPNCIHICERSLETDKYVFAKMLYDDKKIREIDWNIYNYWFNTFLEKVPTDLIIYVNTSTENCNTRILQRNRDGESSIPFEYLQSCHNYHNSWLSNTKIPVNTINGNIDITNSDKYNKFIKSVMEMI